MGSVQSVLCPGVEAVDVDTLTPTLVAFVIEMAEWTKLVGSLAPQGFGLTMSSHQVDWVWSRGVEPILLDDLLLLLLSMVVRIDLGGRNFPHEWRFATGNGKQPRDLPYLHFVGAQATMTMVLCTALGLCAVETDYAEQEVDQVRLCESRRVK